MHTHRPAARLIRPPGQHLHRDATFGRQRQHSLQREFFHPAQPGPVRRRQRKLHEHAARHDHPAEHRMTSQPRIICQRQAAGQHKTTAVRHRDSSPQQRMTGSRQPRRGHISTRPAVLQPEPLTLERIRRKINPPRLPRPEKPAPVHPKPAAVQLTQRTQQAPEIALITAQRPGHHNRGPRLLRRFRQRHHKSRMRAGLNKEPVTISQQAPARSRERDRLTQTAVPVISIQHRRLQPPPGKSRVKRHRRLPRLQPGQRLTHLLLHHIDLPAMRRIIHAQLPGENPRASQLPHQRINRTRLPRHQPKRRTVHRRDTQPPARTPHTLPQLTFRQLHRRHRRPAPPAASAPGCATPPPRRVLQRQRPRHVRRRDLALAVTHHRIRLHPVDRHNAASDTITANSTG